MDYVDEVFYWELEYVRYIFYYVGLRGFGLDVDCKFINFGVFDLLENLISISGNNEELCFKFERKILFDGVIEIVSLRYERVFFGSYKERVKWGMLFENEWLIEDIYKEIICL